MNIAVITGASSGMGKEFVLQLENHFNVDEVWVIARRKEILDSLALHLVKTKVRSFPLDLTLESSYEFLQKALIEAKPHINLLVNACGIGYFGKYENISLQNDLKTVDLNIKSYLAITKICLPFMSKGDYIVNVGSLGAYQPVPYETVYCASKAFILSYSRAIYAELKPYGIRVMSVNPGWVLTEFFNNSFKTNDDHAVQYFNKLYLPEDVVKKAYHDLLKTKKMESALGLGVRNQIRLVKFMPTRFVMNTWIKQNKKAKNFAEVEDNINKKN